ncbi:MAG: hypothetical protein U1B80_09630 [Anaerolineaceae bacterium]|nr:hypothetical protein [Anaerolineaceae bacterium]
MPKTFITERDIESLYQGGMRSLVVGRDKTLTDLAYEKARQLGLKLVSESEGAPSADAKQVLPGFDSETIKHRVREAVQARLGDQINPRLLETIIQRVFCNIGVK